VLSKFHPKKTKNEKKSSTHFSSKDSPGKGNSSPHDKKILSGTGTLQINTIANFSNQTLSPLTNPATTSPSPHPPSSTHGSISKITNVG
jgi:hypothetical protein